MKSFQYLSLLLVLAEDVSIVTALPTLPTLPTVGSLSPVLDTVNDAVAEVAPGVALKSRSFLSDLAKAVTSTTGVKASITTRDDSLEDRSFLSDLAKAVTSTTDASADLSKVATRDNSPLEAIGEVVGSVGPVLEDTVPRVPINRRHIDNTTPSGAAASIKQAAQDAANTVAGKTVNLDETIPLNAFKAKRDADDVTNIAGHNLPAWLLASIPPKVDAVEDALPAAGKRSDENLNNLPAWLVGSISPKVDAVEDTLKDILPTAGKRSDENLNNLPAWLVGSISPKVDAVEDTLKDVLPTAGKRSDENLNNLPAWLVGSIPPKVDAIEDTLKDVLPTTGKRSDENLNNLPAWLIGSVSPKIDAVTDTLGDVLPAAGKRSDENLDNLPAWLVGSIPPKIDAVTDTLGDVLPTAAAAGKRSEDGHAKRATFDAEAQRIDVTGEHAFVAPDFENGDVRGPCPGLNVLANHGYLPHNGVASITEYIVGVNTVFGMGIELATFLAIYGTVLGGNPLSLNPGVSMGPESADSQNLLGNLGGLLGTPRGLSGTHNSFEVDGSSTRGDTYDPDGESTVMNMTYFMHLYDLQKDAEEPNYTMDVMLEHNKFRFEQSVAYNPYFYYGPWTGFIVRNAAYCFAGRLFRNASEEHPDGLLDKTNLKSFFSVYGPEDNLTYVPGWERIPDVWYRPAGDYGVAETMADLIEWGTKFPTLLGVGGNTNGVNTYTGIDVGNITGGVLNAEDLLVGNNLICFAFQVVKEGTPNSLSSLFKTIAAPLKMVLDAVDSTILSLDCPAFNDLSVNGKDFGEYIKETYPGVAKSGGAI